MPAADEQAQAALAQAPARRPRFRRWLMRRFYNLPVRKKLLVGEAVINLALARLALFFMPFRSLAAWFGTLSVPGDGVKGPAPRSDQLEVVQEVGWAVTRAARYVPFRAVCLPQAIAAKAMLNRRDVPNVMHFGVAKRTDLPLEAHAWLDAGAVEVTGYPIRHDFVEVARFL